jgi:hypothetical protein
MMKMRKKTKRRVFNLVCIVFGVSTIALGAAFWMSWLGWWAYGALEEKTILPAAYAIVFISLYQLITWIQPRRR